MKLQRSDNSHRYKICADEVNIVVVFSRFLLFFRVLGRDGVARGFFDAARRDVELLSDVLSAGPLAGWGFAVSLISFLLSIPPFLADVNSRSRSLLAIADPSVCRLSVCL